MRINYDFTDLETFLAVMETGAFHAAAERLNLSQPSVTRRIAKLEDALGATLFERTTRAVRPTLAAKRLQVSAEAMLDTAAETARALGDESQAFAHQRAQVLTVATIPTVLRHLLAPAIRALRTERPGLRLRILDLGANGVADAVAAGEADIGISSVPLHDPATRFERLFEDPIVIALPAGHELAARERLHWRDLRDAPLILPARGTGNRLLIDDALARTSDGLRWTFEVGRSTTTLGLVADGIGVAPLPRIALWDRPPGRVQWRPVTGPDIRRPIGLLTRSTGQAGAAAAAFAEAVRAQARTLPG